VTTRSGSANPRRLRSSKNAVPLAVSSFVPGARCSRTFWPSSVMPQAQRTGFAGQAGVQPLGDAVDEEVGHGEFTEVAPGEGFVFLPEPLRHLAHGGPTQHAGPARVAKGGLDVARAQPARVHLEREALEFGRPTGQARADARHERLGAVRHLRHAILDRALRGAQAPVS